MFKFSKTNCTRNISWRFHLIFQASSCSNPWAGQLRDCDQWLRYKQSEEAYSHSHLLLASYQNGYLVAHGESSGAYHSSLQLESLYRSFVLLDDELGVVIDFIKTKISSNVSKVAMMFNNAVNRLYPYQYSLSFSQNLQGFKMSSRERLYYCVWISKDGHSPVGKFSTLKYYSKNELLSVSNVNVSFPIANNEESAVFLFFSDNIHLKNVQLTKTNSLVQLSLSITKYGQPMAFNITVDSTISNINIKQSTQRQQVTSCMFPFILYFLAIGVSLSIGNILRNWRKNLLQKYFKCIYNSLCQ